MKKIITFGIGLFIIIIHLTACKQGNIVTLESMKKTLNDAGYTVNEDYTEIYESYETSMHSIAGFSFVFPGAHGNINTPVLEFENNTAAKAYAEIVKISGHFIAVVNDKFLTVMETHNGIAHESEKIFLENLINGKSIK